MGKIINGLIYIVLGLFFAGLFFGHFAWKYSVWNECRVDHSIGYCWSLTSK